MSNSCRAAGILGGHGDDLQVEKMQGVIYCHPFHSLIPLTLGMDILSLS